MRENGLNIDLRAMAESLKETVSKFGGFSPQQVREAAMSDSSTRAGILRALSQGPMTGHQVMQAIKDESGFGNAPSASRIYPLLENLVDQQLISAAVKKDRKVYSITELGAQELKNDPTSGSGENFTGENLSGETRDGESSWPFPKWVDLRGAVPRASARLANVAIEISKNGTREQQDAAAEIMDEARRKIHKLLSEG